MPRRPSPINTTELNATLRRLYSRTQGGPRHPALCVLIVHSLMHRWRRSPRRHDKRLLRIVERLGEIEKHVEDLGGDVWGELERPGRGFFGPLLEDLTLQVLDARVPVHDPRTLRLQYNELWTYVQRHPVPKASTLRNKDLRAKEMKNGLVAWLNTYWNECGKVMMEYPCHCQYRRLEPTYADLYRKTHFTTRHNLLLRLLGHLHKTDPSSIEHDLKPSRRIVLEQRM